MSSSGLIYAVIVGAWAAYLVPMWLRRQDELNEARPTERFSTAIRLLSGRAAMERRYAKGLEGQGGRSTDDAGEVREPDAVAEEADVRDFDAPADEVPPAAQRQPAPAAGGATGPAPRPVKKPGFGRASTADRMKRAKVLARRRRTTTVLFLAFTVGTVVAAVGGLAFLWAPAIPAILLSAYIVYLRAQERRRFTFTMDQRQAEAAAQRLREGRPRPPQASQQPPADEAPAEDAATTPPAPARTPAPAPRPEPASTAGRRALVEETDHAEWVDQQRERERTEPGGWDPVPVPLPTYVTAPVAPRATSHVDLDADDAWSSARSGPATETPQPTPSATPQRRTTPGRRTRGRTPLFDQYADEDRPRAANE
ncbi:divisome protein SepX/GlpR [Streptomyces monomycini]|uniref:divisome protein SepX/GlpR n=2 Tax=Streptomyces monomycini TaxID=371720 RepID=UPI001EEAEF68|nr:gephyrin-like molybdotransferase receptor GlpR [Streptomyces monomycini]